MNFEILTSTEERGGEEDSRQRLRRLLHALEIHHVMSVGGGTAVLVVSIGGNNRGSAEVRLPRPPPAPAINLEPPRRSPERDREEAIALMSSRTRRKQKKLERQRLKK